MRLMERVRPVNIEGNMGPRARLWRAMCDYGWFRDLGRPVPMATWKAARRFF